MSIKEEFSNQQTVHLTDVKVAPNIAPTKFKLVKSELNGRYVEIAFTLELRTLVFFELTLDEGLKGFSSNIGQVSYKKGDKNVLHGFVTVGAVPKEPYYMEFKLIVSISGDCGAIY